MNQYSVIWINENTRKQLKKIAVDKEISMRELASTIINDWISSEERQRRNDTTKPPDADQTRMKPDA